MDPLTPLDTLCRIVLRAREYEAQVPTDFEGNEAAENADDEGGEILSALDNTINTSVEEEIRAALDDLGEDQLAEVLAFCWVGQGTYDATDWDEAMDEARSSSALRSSSSTLVLIVSSSADNVSPPSSSTFSAASLPSKSVGTCASYSRARRTIRQSVSSEVSGSISFSFDVVRLTRPRGGGSAHSAKARRAR